jgi:hypothetical protein
MFFMQQKYRNPRGYSSLFSSVSPFSFSSFFGGLKGIVRSTGGVIEKSIAVLSLHGGE